MGRREREAVARAARLYEAAQGLADDHGRAVEAVRAALKPLQDAAVEQALDAISVARLQDATDGRLRLGGVDRNGLRTVRQVLEAGPYRLRQIPGVGQRTADQIVAAARQLSDAVRDTVAVHIDVDRPEPRTTALVMALHVLVEAGPEARRAVGTAAELTERLGPLLSEARPASGRLSMLLAGRARKARALEAVEELRTLVAEAAEAGAHEALAQASVDLLRGASNDLAAWVDFELRSADYYGLLAEISGRAPDTAAAEGFLPDGIAERVRGQQLDDSRLRVSLRGYQAFGARFALAQRRVILGDEMGLGKTVQAMAALTHLAAEGQSHFMVVCPASVLVNWTREIEARTSLRVTPLHGPDRHGAFASWKGRGGVAVTTFDALRGFPVPGGGEIGMLVVDEAHCVKNPRALRSRAVTQWAGHCERVLFMTGTPMENRVAEFRNLVRMLDETVAERIGDGAGLPGSVAFRKAVAPVYLRRNQVDVLAELPALQQTDEWEEPSTSDEEAYREAVASGNFMAMRRAAYARPEKSAKLVRLREIVQEAGENGLKVVVFSNFRDVLGAVKDALGAGSRAGGPVVGPLTGSVPPERRQSLVDEFTAVSGPAVLLAQIQAGGVGLNLQAASVVIICEPQIKPTVEQQAVARAHRMGQVRPVRVHRLLAPGGVDERMVEMLRRKVRLFDAYARRSAVAEATPDAVDVSDTEMARLIVAEEQTRLGFSTGRAGGASDAPADALPGAGTGEAAGGDA
ncbi:RNA polymerase-associated protein RapA [Streptomyces sp. RB17]|uniref:DEAD/DEAH box helicase n=1 Tax=Streptomyces sp. RB17 TaxID=2585197 RepID=UPI001297FE16|nr:SNF2-related protein [Streptomyces sp. RB17]MQY37321.1 RNA polymerase-associated protein RapA [Streptomyces sp. RB17]